MYFAFFDRKNFLFYPEYLAALYSILEKCHAYPGIATSGIWWEQDQMNIEITVKLFAYFRDDRFKMQKMTIAKGTRVGDIVDSLKIDRHEVGVLMINSRHTEFEHTPVENDILAIFPVVGGG